MDNLTYIDFEQEQKQEKSKQCQYCGEDSENEFCDKQCAKAYITDMGE